MELRIAIELDNAACENCDYGPEVARILRELALSAARMVSIDGKILRDVNGNIVGRCELVA